MTSETTPEDVVCVVYREVTDRLAGAKRAGDTIRVENLTLLAEELRDEFGFYATGE